MAKGGGSKEKLELEIPEPVQITEDEFEGKIMITAKKGDTLLEGVEFRYLAVNGEEMPAPPATDENGRSVADINFVTKAKTMLVEVLAEFEPGKGQKATRRKIPLPRKKKGEIEEIKIIAGPEIQTGKLHVSVSRIDEAGKSLPGKLLIVKPQNQLEEKNSDTGIFHFSFDQEAETKAITLIAEEKPEATLNLIVPPQGTTTIIPEESNEEIITFFLKRSLTEMIKKNFRKGEEGFRLSKERKLQSAPANTAAKKEKKDFLAPLVISVILVILALTGLILSNLT